jgi:hypothetical protein
VLSVVSLRAFAAPAATLPVVALLDMQRESQAKPQLLATCRIDGALGNCRRPPLIDASRGNRRASGCKEALVRQARNEMAMAIVSGVSAEAVEAVALIAATSPRSPRNGESADG